MSVIGPVQSRYREASCKRLSDSVISTAGVIFRLLQATSTAARFISRAFSEKMSNSLVFSQPSIYIDGWLYAMSMTSVVCNVPVLSQNDSTSSFCLHDMKVTSLRYLDAKFHRVD